MTVYDTLKANSLLLMKLKRAGMITVNPIYRMRLYEDFLTTKGTKKDRYDQLSKKHGIHSKTVSKIINKLSQPL